MKHSHYFKKVPHDRLSINDILYMFDVHDWNISVALIALLSGTLEEGVMEVNIPYEYVDVYRVLEIFNVTSPSVAHAIKKLLVAGNRGHKDLEKDIQEAIDSLLRWKKMREEERELNIYDYDMISLYEEDVEDAIACLYEWQKQQEYKEIES